MFLIVYLNTKKRLKELRIFVLGLGWMATILSLSGKFFVTVAFCVNFIYVAELYPTCLRSAGLNTCSTIGGIGSVICPYIYMLVSKTYILYHS